MINITQGKDAKDLAANVQRFREGITERRILVREIVFDYNKNKNTLQTRVEGPTQLGLTSTFLDKTSEQFDKLHNEVIQPLIKKIKATFSLRINVDATGEFSFDNINIVFKFDCRGKGKVRDIFYLPFKTLIPFTEYIDYISLRGNDYNLAVIEAEVNLHLLDLTDVIVQPINGPKAEIQWYEFVMEAVARAKEEYKIDIVLPVSEGEVTWNIPHSRKLHILEHIGEKVTN